MKCCRCDREVKESNTRIDDWLKKPACKLCRLKMEMLSSPRLSFGVDISTGETFSSKYLWDEKTSKVLAEADTFFD